MDRSQIIAVDFDGTLCFSAWPDVGEPNNPLGGAYSIDRMYRTEGLS